MTFNKEKKTEKFSENMEYKSVDMDSDILQEMIDEAKNIGVAPWTIFLKDIGMIKVLDMTGTINRATGEHKLLVLDDEGGMWQIKEEYVIAQRNNIIKPEDYEHFNEMKKQAEENTRLWEESEAKLGLNNGFM